MQPSKGHRRARVPLSCDPCRARKLKCNREKPCQNCSVRGDDAACNFRGSAPKNSTVSAVPDTPSVPLTVPAVRRDANGDTLVRQRVDKLENLVRRLIAERQHVATSAAKETNAAYTPGSSALEMEPRLSVVGADPGASEVVTGQTVVDGTHSVYHGGYEWYTVLQEINELKKTLGQEEDPEDEQGRNLGPSLSLSHTIDGSGLLFSEAKPIERIQILSTLPPKPEVDRLVALFFDRPNFPLSVPPILHQPTFMKEYDEHWKDPLKTKIMWVGLLFSILGVVMLSFHRYGEPPEYEGISESLFQLYRIRTAQCLLSGDIAKCLPYTVETLRFNATAELNRKDDNRRGTWIMTGVVVRAAINMGYHRDPSHSSAFSVLQAEYRRRIWLSVISMDDMSSFLGGFPRMMSAVYSDTRKPHNVYDWELDEGTVDLPPSRPLEEPTPAAYLIVKGRLFRALGRVADVNSAPVLCKYQNILEIDRALQEAHESVPRHLQAVFSGEHDGSGRSRRVTNSSGLSLLVMYHKGMCTLHRNFMVKANVDSRYRFSRDRCVSSALAILAIEDVLEAGLYGISQTRQMLALAAMILFLELELRRKAPKMAVSPDGEVILRALEKSSAGWAKAVDTCDEAVRIWQVLDGMLSSYRRGSGGGAASTGSSHTESMSAPAGLPVSTPADSFSFEKDLSNMDFDWASWDTFIEEVGHGTAPIY